MPQGRHKVPFSNKQKKVQLQQKREKKRDAEISGDTSVVSNFSKPKKITSDLTIINAQPTASSNKHTNRFNLVFKKETAEELKQKREMSYIPFARFPEESLEVRYEDVYKPGTELDIPKRPPWNFSVSKSVLEMREQKYFREYLQNLESAFGDQELSHFEMNLETWRQLWRVVEFSDIILQVIDIRYPVYHFSPALYNYVTSELKKDMILVINKIDLVPAPLVLAWLEYFKAQFPKLKIMCFASYAGMVLKIGKRGRRVGNLHMAIAGAQQLLKLCEETVGSKVDLSSWKQKIDREASAIGDRGDEYKDDDDSGDGSGDETEVNVVQKVDTSYYEGERYRDGVLTIGFVGYPNVGKSSFLNAIRGKKVVSVSRTPGHTKHFQTILLTENVRLCDCPGLVFPSLVPKPSQVLMGCFPIAQLREPFSAVQFLAQRIDLPAMLKITHPNAEKFETNGTVQWSSYEICSAWAEKRGFFTARAARPDVFRAANHILRAALDGTTICLALYPPDYTSQKAMWANHSRLPEVIAVQSHRKKRELASKYQESDFPDISEEEESQSEEEESLSEEESSDEEPKLKSDAKNKFLLLGENTC